MTTASTSGIERVAVHGVGHFGYAMIRHLASKKQPPATIRGFDVNDDVRRALQRDRRHPFHHAQSPLPKRVEIVDDVRTLLDGADMLILAVNSSATREVAASLVEIGWSGALPIVNTAKALDFETGRRLSEIIADALEKASLEFRYAALAGGTIADELLHAEPLGMTIACEDEPMLKRLRPLFSSDTMWVQTTTDLVGVEYAAALKNVVSICAGMARGMNLSIGGVTHLISRMAFEIEDFCVRILGADRATFSIGSQCWGSDLWMSCIGPTRNGALGEMLGQGRSLEEAEREMASQHKTVEGVQTLRALRRVIAEHPGELPLLRAAERVILEDAPASALIDALMASDHARLDQPPA